MRALAGIPPRVAVHLVLAALPLLSITAHVAGLVPMHVTAGLVVVPTALVLVVLGIFVPMPEDRLVLEGLRWGILATAVYDVFRLDTVALLGWWGDFIPTMGTWLIDVDPSSRVLGGVAGYLWRYAGDGGGLGVVFVVGAAATGLRRLGPAATVAAAVLFAVGPTWGGLMVTVLLPRGQQLMFPLTPVTVGLSLAGHVIFGIVLGLGCLRCRDLERHWSGRRVVDLEKLARWGELPYPVPVPALADIPASALPGRPASALPGRAASALPGRAASALPARPALAAGATASGSFRSPAAVMSSGRPRPLGAGMVPVPRTDSGAFEVTVVDATVVDGMAPVPPGGPGAVAGAAGGVSPLPWGSTPPDDGRPAARPWGSSPPGDARPAAPRWGAGPQADPDRCGRRSVGPAPEAADFGLRSARAAAPRSPRGEGRIRAL